MSYYRKPLKNGGSRMIARASSGRFARTSLGAEYCRSGDCRAFILPDVVVENGFPTKRWPEVCHRCGKDWREPAPQSGGEGT